MNVLVWFRHDLRITDHPALALGASMGRVLPLHVVVPGDWQRPEASARQWGFVAECLAGLQAGMAALGAPLVLRCGDPVEVIGRMLRQYDIGLVLSQPGDGSATDRAVDQRLAAYLAQTGIQWQQMPEPGVAGDALVEGDLPAPRVLTPVAGVAPGVVPAARALGLAADPCPHRQTGGRDNALTLLAGGALRLAGGSGLSPWLAQGVLGPSDLAALAEAPLLQAGIARRAACRRQMRAGPGLDLAARAALPGDGAHLTAFAAGETGLPRVDAGLRALRATGRLPASERALLAGVALHLLALDWRRVGEVLARLSVDHDPAILWPQMQAAATAAPPDPLRLPEQGLAGLRRWLPELAPVPDACLLAPWRWSGAARLLGRRYPEPLIDPLSARRDWRARRPAAAAPGAPVRGGGSHSRLDRLLVWPDRASRTPAGGGQLCLDL